MTLFKTFFYINHLDCAALMWRARHSVGLCSRYLFQIGNCTARSNRLKLCIRICRSIYEDGVEMWRYVLLYCFFSAIFSMNSFSEIRVFLFLVIVLFYCCCCYCLLRVALLLSFSFHFAFFSLSHFRCLRAQMANKGNKERQKKHHSFQYPEQKALNKTFPSVFFFCSTSIWFCLFRDLA